MEHRRLHVPVGIAALALHGDAYDLGVMILPKWQGRCATFTIMKEIVDGAMSGRWCDFITTLACHHHVRNHAVRRLAVGLGFVPKGSIGDQVAWSMSRADWNCARLTKTA
jgi:hypothetical protein